MDIRDVPKITPEIRSSMKSIFDARYEELKNNISEMITYPPGDYVDEHIYTNTFQHDVLNMIRNHDGSPLMCVFNFSVRNHVRLYKILGIADMKPLINGLRVFPHQVVAMHRDPNRGNIGREHPIFTSIVNGEDGCVYLSNRIDGSRLAAIPGLSDFVMVPSEIEHGASSGESSYDLIQIQLSKPL